MKLKCPECGAVCESSILQRISSRSCEIKSFFNIIEVRCINCGNKNIMNVTPKGIKVFNEFEKVVRFQ